MLQKEFTDQYGNTANFLVPDITENMQEDEATGIISCNLMFVAYKDQLAYEAGMKPVDCFRDGTKEITQEELMAADGTTMGAKLKNAFILKAIESILDEEGNETNLFQGNIGLIGFQDSTIV